MTDRELIELAAKAAGLSRAIVYDAYPDDGFPAPYAKLEKHIYWNPLIDDDDALRLAVKLGMDLLRTEVDIEAIATLPPYAPMERNVPAPFGIEQLGDDPYAATRRAIVRAAAEIGKSMP